MNRLVEPEILDELAWDDPEAVRSRRDLRLVNGLMGNLRWMRRVLDRLGVRRVVEIGAGGGELLEGLAGKGREVLGVDLAPRPKRLKDGVEWIQGDVREVLAGMTSGSGKGRGTGRGFVAGNLILHHFEDGALHELGSVLRRFEGLCFSEPRRSPLALAEGYALWPLVNRVTRHDMMASIRAGFVRGELPRLLDLDGAAWNVCERSTLRGACRLVAWRRR